MPVDILTQIGQQVGQLAQIGQQIGQLAFVKNSGVLPDEHVATLMSKSRHHDHDLIYKGLQKFWKCNLCELRSSHKQRKHLTTTRWSCSRKGCSWSICCHCFREEAREDPKHTNLAGAEVSRSSKPGNAETWYCGHKLADGQCGPNDGPQCEDCKVFEPSILRAGGCSGACRRNHGFKNACLVCGGAWGDHSGHSCPPSGQEGVGGQRGSFRTVAFPKRISFASKKEEISNRIIKGMFTAISDGLSDETKEEQDNLSSSRWKFTREQKGKSTEAILALSGRLFEFFDPHKTGRLDIRALVKWQRVTYGFSSPAEYIFGDITDEQIIMYLTELLNSIGFDKSDWDPANGLSSEGFLQLYRSRAGDLSTALVLANSHWRHVQNKISAAPPDHEKIKYIFDIFDKDTRGRTDQRLSLDALVAYNILFAKQPMFKEMDPKDVRTLILHTFQQSFSQDDFQPELGLAFDAFYSAFYHGQGQLLDADYEAMQNTRVVFDPSTSTWTAEGPSGRTVVVGDQSRECLNTECANMVGDPTRKFCCGECVVSGEQAKHWQERDGLNDETQWFNKKTLKMSPTKPAILLMCEEGCGKLADPTNNSGYCCQECKLGNRCGIECGHLTLSSRQSVARKPQVIDLKDKDPANWILEMKYSSLLYKNKLTGKITNLQPYCLTKLEEDPASWRKRGEAYININTNRKTRIKPVCFSTCIAPDCRFLKSSNPLAGGLCCAGCVDSLAAHTADCSQLELDVSPPVLVLSPSDAKASSWKGEECENPKCSRLKHTDPAWGNKKYCCLRCGEEEGGNDYMLGSDPGHDAMCQRELKCKWFNKGCRRLLLAENEIDFSASCCPSCDKAHSFGSAEVQVVAHNEMLCGINVCDYDMRLGTKTELELNGLLINVQVDPLAHVTIQKADGVRSARIREGKGKQGTLSILDKCQRADCPYLCHPDFSFANGYCCPLCRDHKGSYDQLQGHSAPLDEPPGTGQGNMRQRLLCHQRPAPRDLYGTTGGQVRTARLRKENFFASRLAALHSRYSTPAMSKCGFFLMTLLIALYKSLIAFTWLWCLLNFLAPDTFQLFNQAENVRRALVQGLDIIELCPSIEESFFLDALGVKLVQFQQTKIQALRHSNYVNFDGPDFEILDFNNDTLVMQSDFVDGQGRVSKEKVKIYTQAWVTIDLNQNYDIPQEDLDNVYELMGVEQDASFISASQFDDFRRGIFFNSLNQIWYFHEDLCPNPQAWAALVPPCITAAVNCRGTRCRTDEQDGQCERVEGTTFHANAHSLGSAYPVLIGGHAALAFFVSWMWVIPAAAEKGGVSHKRTGKFFGLVLLLHLFFGLSGGSVLMTARGIYPENYIGYGGTSFSFMLFAEFSFLGCIMLDFWTTGFTAMHYKVYVPGPPRQQSKEWLVWRVASVYFFATTAFVGIVLFGCGLKQLATFGQLSRKAAIGTTDEAVYTFLWLTQVPVFVYLSFCSFAFRWTMPRRDCSHWLYGGWKYPKAVQFESKEVFRALLGPQEHANKMIGCSTLVTVTFFANIFFRFYPLATPWVWIVCHIVEIIAFVRTRKAAIAKASRILSMRDKLHLNGDLLGYFIARAASEFESCRHSPPCVAQPLDSKRHPSCKLKFSATYLDARACEDFKAYQEQVQALKDKVLQEAATGVAGLNPGLKQEQTMEEQKPQPQGKVNAVIEVPTRGKKRAKTKKKKKQDSAVTVSEDVELTESTKVVSTPDAESSLPAPELSDQSASGELDKEGTLLEEMLKPSGLEESPVHEAASV